MTMNDHPCRRCHGDASMHEFYVGGGRFAWCLPHFDTGIRAAEPVTKVMLNRYPHNLIGAAVYVLGHGFGVRWKDTPSYHRGPRHHPLRWLRAVMSIGGAS
jgi:hypothetical protein